MEHEDALFATFVLSFVSMIFLCGRERGAFVEEGNMVEENREVSQIDGRMRGRARKAL